MNVIWQACSDLSCYQAEFEIALVHHHVMSTATNRTQHQQQNQCGFSVSDLSIK